MNHMESACRSFGPCLDGSEFHAVSARKTPTPCPNSENSRKRTEPLGRQELLLSGLGKLSRALTRQRLVPRLFGTRMAGKMFKAREQIKSPSPPACFTTAMHVASSPYPQAISRHRGPSLASNPL